MWSNCELQEERNSLILDGTWGYLPPPHSVMWRSRSALCVPWSKGVFTRVCAHRSGERSNETQNLTLPQCIGKQDSLGGRFQTLCLKSVRKHVDEGMWLFIPLPFNNNNNNKTFIRFHRDLHWESQLHSEMGGKSCYDEHLASALPAYFNVWR